MKTDREVGGYWAAVFTGLLLYPSFGSGANRSTKEGKVPRTIGCFDILQVIYVCVYCCIERRRKK